MAHNLDEKKIEELLAYFPAEGEGRGRLSLQKNQYLFGFEALLKQNDEWILATNIPLHGEEVLKFSDLKRSQETFKIRHGMELKIEKGIGDYLIGQKKNPRLAKIFLEELRSLVRLIVHRQLGIKMNCTMSSCQIDESIYQIKSSPKQLSFKKKIQEGHEIEFVALSLKGTQFKRTSIFFRSINAADSSPPILALELFWN